MHSPYQVVLDHEDRAALTALLARPTATQRQALRARIVLAAAGGLSNAAIAVRLGVCADTVRKWRRRFCSQGMAGLVDQPRSGRPPQFTPVQVAQVKAIACELPATRGLPLSRWSSIEAIAAGIVVDVSASTVRRWLAADALKPWRHRPWIFPRDPDFAAKAAPVLDLYHRQWRGCAT
jgi:transposase